MDMLFFAAIGTGLIEGLVQYIWLSSYFKFGVPILVAQVPFLDGVPVPKRELISLKAVGGGRFLVRQRHYGIARYAYYHGFIRALENRADHHQAQCILLVDWNVLIVGAFIFCAMSEFNGLSVFLGIASGVILAAAIANVHRRSILLYCARAMATSKVVSDPV